VARPPRGIAALAGNSREVVIPAAIVGIITGLAVALADAITIDWLLEGIRELPVGVLAFAPLVGLAVAAVILTYLGRRASPALTDTWLRAFHDRDRDMDVRQAPGSVLGSIVTIGFGGALGMEGLALYLGGAIGTAFQHRLRRLFPPVDAKMLMTAGAAAGVAAIFKAPATGALFALEVPYQDDFARRKLLPALIAAATGYLGFALVHGTEPLFALRGAPGLDAKNITGAVVLGVAAGLAARGFALMLAAAKRVQGAAPLVLRIVGAGLTLAALFALGRALTGRSLLLGPGYDCITWALSPSRAVPAVLVLLLLRCLATATTVAGGGAGGLFIPLVVGGALLGRAVGGIFDALDNTLFLVVGVSAFLGAGYGVPLAAVMFVAETTGKAGYVVPALLAAVAADLVMGHRCITAYQLPRETV
jgi:CIC family chloride channel protein